MSDQEKKSKVKMVKIQAQSPIRVDGKMINPGETVECDEELAAQFCKPLTGTYNYSGERTEREAKALVSTTVRAKMVA